MIVRALKVLGCSLYYYVRFLAGFLLGKLLVVILALAASKSGVFVLHLLVSYNTIILA